MNDFKLDRERSRKLSLLPAVLLYIPLKFGFLKRKIWFSGMLTMSFLKHGRMHASFHVMLLLLLCMTWKWSFFLLFLFPSVNEIYYLQGTSFIRLSSHRVPCSKAMRVTVVPHRSLSDGLSCRRGDFTHGTSEKRVKQRWVCV